ncbi:hypothetical protein FE257_007529 [Aspergillus nanangensis]|uniref:Zn(2)-C6 fungal-type domain-containing protein n=1 Tax=Aspergillus nanangensis TaxID=2582783 RepID=A0AAD4CML5_ASPNN|nr:hypothetical protein FE257_007529 [Aspergillus nanangensis]
MPIHKLHTKSRYGCDGCRQRKVKCDEQGPPCSNCILRDDTCTYSRIPPARRLAIARHPTPPAAVDALELMHMFSTQTYRSLCINDSEIHTWQDLVPQLALRQPYLMHGILALASIHIATTVDAPHASRYIETGLQYHSQSLGPFRAAIDTISPDNCNAVFAQSVVIVAISIALPQATVRRGVAELKPGQSMIETIRTIFELLQGVKKILSAGHSWINLALFSNGEFWRKDGIGVVGGELDSATDTALNVLVALTEHQRASNPLCRVDDRIIPHLRHCFEKFTRSPDPAPVLAWLAAVDEAFVRGIQRRQPLLLLILMYWGVLLGELDGRRWWAHRSGRALVLELLYCLDDREDGDCKETEWEVCLSWVRHKVGL